MTGPTAAGSSRDTVAVGCVFLWQKDPPIGNCTFVARHHGWKWSWSCSCYTGLPCCRSDKGLFCYSHTVTQKWVAGTTQALEDRAGHALLSCQQLPASRHVCHFFAWLKTKLKRCMNSPTVTPSVILPPINQLLCACVDRKRSSIKLSTNISTFAGLNWACKQAAMAENMLFSRGDFLRLFFPLLALHTVAFMLLSTVNGLQECKGQFSAH